VILNASGCLDAITAPDVARELDAFVTKTVTPLPREGNPPVRIAETDVGMLNSIGLANPGIDRFLHEVLPQLLDVGPPVWVSVGGFAAEEYADLCARLDCTDAAALELNLSCPNVAAPEDEATAIVTAARAATAKPLFAKVAPGLPDLPAVAQAAAAAGADGLSLVNTIRGLALDPETLEPRLGTETGGLSGRALRPIALAAVHAAYRTTELPIVAMGGVETGAHALELIAAGASAIALGTILFADPDAPARVRRELDEEAARRGFAEPLAVQGVAHGGPVQGPARVLPVLQTPPAAGPVGSP
jgi:dihydroorotate dehydrogenase (NAD+) catalytic subunit